MDLNYKQNEIPKKNVEYTLDVDLFKIARISKMSI